MSKLKLATVWLDGCSGCHMSFLDMDERLLELAELVDLVYSPLVDAKEFPDEVDIALVEGAVASVDDEKKIKKDSRALQDAGGDGRLRHHRQCAVHAQPHRAGGDSGPRLHRERQRAAADSRASCVPKLLHVVRPIQEFVKVDVFLPGCPPSADTFHTALTALINGGPLDIPALTRFGA